jgi:hypothetical protein
VQRAKGIDMADAKTPVEIQMQVLAWFDERASEFVKQAAYKSLKAFAESIDPDNAPFDNMNAYDPTHGAGYSKNVHGKGILSGVSIHFFNDGMGSGVDISTDTLDEQGGVYNAGRIALVSA